MIKVLIEPLADDESGYAAQAADLASRLKQAGARAVLRQR
jgi:hypothetical protein